MPPNRNSKPKLDSRSVSGRPRKQELRILRRWGYVDKDIAAMDSRQQAAEIQEAIKAGIYVGSLPSGPIEDSEPSVFLDAESGKPIGLSEVAKVGICILQVPEERRIHSFKQALACFRQDQTLDSADREHLERLAADSRIDEHWNLLEGFRPVVTWASPGWFIWHVLAARRAAEFVRDYPDRQLHAQNAERLTKFLRQKGEMDEPSCQLLEDLARQLREPEEFQPFNPIPIPVSRKSRNTFRGHATHNSRELKAFMHWMSNHLKSTYGNRSTNWLPLLPTSLSRAEKQPSIRCVPRSSRPLKQGGQAGDRNAVLVHPPHECTIERRNNSDICCHPELPSVFCGVIKMHSPDVCRASARQPAHSECSTNGRP